ncbi:MAG: fibronectin type III domain-containing protein [bacterium]|nr:fibronectin type III domain-containing protein [bacterium]
MNISKSRFSVVSLVVVLLLSLSGYYYFDFDDKEGPPKLSMGSSIVKGMMENGKQGFLEFEESDKVSYNSKKSSFKGSPITLKTGPNNVYVDEKYTLDELVQCINPQVERFLFAEYNPIEKTYFTYPKGPFGSATKIVPGKLSYEVKAGKAFTVIVRRDGEAYCMKSANQKSSYPITKPLADDKSGWVLMAAHDSDLNKVILPYKDRVKSIYKMKDAENFEKVTDMNVKLKDYYVIWLKLGKKGEAQASVSAHTDVGSTQQAQQLPQQLQQQQQPQVTAPGVPKNITVKSLPGGESHGTIVDWDTPDTDGGSSITEYLVRVKNVSNFTEANYSAGTSTEYTYMNPMETIGQFIFYVKAKNAVGTSSEAEYATTLAGQLKPVTPPSCTDSDGIDYFKKGTVTSSLYPKGKEDYIQTFDTGKTYVMEGACNDKNNYYYIKKNCAALGSYEAKDGICVAVEPIAFAHPAPINVKVSVYNKNSSTLTLDWDYPSNYDDSLTIPNWTIEYFNMHEWGQSPKIIHEIPSNTGGSVHLFNNITFVDGNSQDAANKNHYKFKVKANYSDGKSSSYTVTLTYMLE